MGFAKLRRDDAGKQPNCARGIARQIVRGCGLGQGSRITSGFARQGPLQPEGERSFRPDWDPNGVWLEIVLV